MINWQNGIDTSAFYEHSNLNRVYRNTNIIVTKQYQTNLLPNI